MTRGPKPTQKELIKKKKLLKKKLMRLKFKDTCFCPQKATKLISNLRHMTPRKPNSARRKVFFSQFLNLFWSRDFIYLPGEGEKTVHQSTKQGLASHSLVLARNGLTKDLRGLKYKIMHGAQIRRFKFYGLDYLKNARSKYGARRTRKEKTLLNKRRSKIKKLDPNFYKKQRVCSNRFYN